MGLNPLFLVQMREPTVRINENWARNTGYELRPLEKDENGLAKRGFVANVL
jgi:hypothetical protein